MTPETASFLLDILGRVTLSAADPDFDQLARQVSEARKELATLTLPEPSG